MKKVNLLLGVVLGSVFLLPSVVWSQGNCPNLNFGFGNFTGWQCYAGSSSPYSVSPTLPIPGRHTIMDADALQKTGQFYDEVCNLLPKVPDGYNFSCKLGNSSTGAEAEGIEYEMVVDSTNSLLLLSFAFVLQRAGHSQNDQPKFTITIKDSLGIPSLFFPCGMFPYPPPKPIPLLCSASADASAWVTRVYDLTPFMGQKIKVYFETWDCPPQGHYGYAYVVAECRPMRIDLQYCDSQNIARMIAPEGFESYTWRRSSVPSWRAYTRQINIANPPLGEIFTVDIVNDLGCTSQLQTVIEKTNIAANFMYGVKDANGQVIFANNNYQNWYDTCSRTATFVDFSKIYNNKKGKTIWEINGLYATSQDSMWTFQFPDPQGNSPVTYQVKLMVVAENGCADTTSQSITIYPSSIVKIDGPSQLCEGKIEYLTAKTIRSTFVEHYWSWKKSNDGSTGNAMGDSLLITGPGMYCLRSLDTNNCYAYDTVMVTSLKAEITDLVIKDVDCFGNTTGYFQHGKITGGNGTFVTAVWTIWDNNNQVLVDSNVISKIGSIIIFRNQAAGTYTFHGMDSEGCPVTATLTIKEPDSLQISAIPKRATCSKDNGAIEMAVTGGTLPYNISVNGQGNKILAKLPADTYIIKIEDKNKCLASDTVIVTDVPIIPLVSISLTEKEIAIDPNKAKLLTVNFYPPEACNQDVVWQSRDTTIATVDANGSVKGIFNGETYIIVTSDDGGLQDSCKVMITNVGVANYELGSMNYLVFPNPTTDGKFSVFGFQFSEMSGEVEIYDVVGRKYDVGAKHVLPNNEIVIDISHLASGLYFLKINHKTIKIIKL
ncbi:MAG: Ig-like domain-containing protein [Lentimicrobiaceae bacterium]|nr:Ig-like domain-containing protein [Lentimicrobiaceae bacterium]